MERNRVNFRSSVSLKDKRVLCVAPHPDDEVIGCGAFLFYISKIMPPELRPLSVTIAYAVSGFNGVSDVFLQKEGIVDHSREKRGEIRRKESTECCQSLGMDPVFWNLPFYEAQQKSFSSNDVIIVKESLLQLEPDVIFLIDEFADPHGTHGIVQRIVLQALQEIGSPADVFGYRVWEGDYLSYECDLVVEFDESIMREKENLISFYRSQLLDPAFPCKEKDFIELAKIANLRIAKGLLSSFLYAECYKKL